MALIPLDFFSRLPDVFSHFLYENTVLVSFRLLSHGPLNAVVFLRKQLTSIMNLCARKG